MQITQIQDTALKLYLGIHINESEADVNDLLFGKILTLAADTIPDFKMCNERLLDRNRDKYHITIFNAAECAKTPILLQNVTGLLVKNSSITYKGLGSLEQDGMITYYVVVDSPVLNALRSDANLLPKDFHITIGFTHKDLFKGRKNEPNVLQFNPSII